MKIYKRILTGYIPLAIIKKVVAGLAHLVERHLAKVEVASSSLVTRSKGSPLIGEPFSF